jgi:hypothetical protein
VLERENSGQSQAKTMKETKKEMLLQKKKRFDLTRVKMSKLMTLIVRPRYSYKSKSK